MLALAFSLPFIAVATLVPRAFAHVGPYKKGMFCENGHSRNYVPNDSTSSAPLNNVPFSQWWMRNCMDYPPAAGDVLELPAGGEFEVELASNKAYTTMRFDRTKEQLKDLWADGLKHPELLTPTALTRMNGSCVSKPNLHAYSKAHAAGTAFAIAYKSNIRDVKFEDLTVFTVAEKTPWERVAKYKVPSLMPACPTAGCICVWGWVPNGCGIANFYMTPFVCKVTNVRADARPIAKPKVPAWCQDEPEKCTPGAKQFITFNAPGTNVNLGHSIEQKEGGWRSPGYNIKMGFRPGAQNDIFVPASTTNIAKPPPASNPTPTVTVAHTTTVTRTVTATQTVQTMFLTPAQANHYADDTDAASKLGITCRRVQSVQRRGGSCPNPDECSEAERGAGLLKRRHRRHLESIH